MSYIFKEKITFSQYKEFIEKQIGLSYMQEDKWAFVKNNKNHMIVAALKNNKVCALAHILIKRKILGYQFYIPNGYIMDFTNIDLLNFFTSEIKKLAQKRRAYVIDIYPNIDKSNPLKEEIHNNLITLNYKHIDEYLDNSVNIIIPLNKINDNNNKSFYLKRGIYFEKTNDISDIKRFKTIINSKHFKENLVNELLEQFKDRVSFIFAKLDLVFYENYLKENNKTEELNKVQELLQISDEIDIGCSIILEPFSKTNEVCDLLYSTVKESFENLKVIEGILNLAIDHCTKKGYKHLKISNFKLNKKLLVNEYDGKIIHYIGNYKIILNKFIYKINKK